MKRTGLLIAALAPGLLLAGCATSAINEMAMSAHQEALASQRLAEQQRASACAAATARCQEDICVVATMLTCAITQPSSPIAAPHLRSPGEEFARGFAPVASLLGTGLQVWGAGWMVDRAGRNAADLVTAMGGVVAQVQGPVDNSVNVGGNYGDTRGDAIGGDLIGGDRIDDRSTGRDRIGRDQRIGDDVRDSCVGERCRNTSPGPWRDPPPAPEPEPDPDPDL